MVILLTDKRLLIISHVIVYKYNDALYLQGGFGRHVDAFARRFKWVYLMSCTKRVRQSMDEYHLRAKNVSIIPLLDFWHNKRVVRYLLMLVSMIQTAIKLSFVAGESDIIHPRLPSPIGNTAALLSRFYHKPIFFYVAGDWEEEILHKGKGPILRLLARAIQFNLRCLVYGRLCFTAGDSLCRKFGDPADQVIPVPTTALDWSHILEPEVALKRAEKEPRELLFVGTVGPAKGVHHLLEAARYLRSIGKDVRLKIIGAPIDSGEWLSQQVQSLGLNGFVLHQPHMAWDRLMREYEKSDIFVLPTRGEGIPKVVGEAMARGLPVVVSDVGGIRSLVRDKENGLLVRSGSSSDIVAAVLALLDDCELRKRLVVNGLHTAQMNDLDTLIDGMLTKVSQYYQLI